MSTKELIAARELIFQNEEKVKRAAELVIANKELLFQNEEKGKRAAELVIANKELVFQNEEKEKRAAELVIANKELIFQNEEKEKRAAELVIANKELVFQNEEKEKRAAELIVANKELAFQNEEKEKRAAELVIANAELAFQNEEKEKRATELDMANKELLAFTYISSHDLQEPLRKIQTFSSRILDKEYSSLSESGKDYFNRLRGCAKRMQTLIQDLLAYSRTSIKDRKFENIQLDKILDEVVSDLSEIIAEKKAVIEASELGIAYIDVLQFRQVMMNLVTNALKFSISDRDPHVVIKSRIAKGIDLETEIDYPNATGSLSPEKEYCHLSVADNGIGFDQKYSDQIFDIFQRLHNKEDYAGTGIGLAIVKKIIENHYGIIAASGELGKGARFDIYLPEA